MDIAAEHRAFVRHLRAKGRRDSTVTTYTKAIDAFAAWLTERGRDPSATTVDRATLEEFFGAQLARGLARQTVHQHHASLRQFFRYVADETEAPNPMAGIAPVSVPANPPPVLEPADLARLFAACAGKTFDDRRDLALLSLLADTGIRRAEVAAIALADLDLDAGEVTVTGKGDRTRTVPFGLTTATRLDRYLRARRAHPAHALPWLWLGRKGRLSAFGIEDAIARRGAAAGVRVHPHLFRHTFAHLWLDGGGQEQDLLKLAGWSSPQMLARYGASAATARARRAYRAGRSPVDKLV